MLMQSHKSACMTVLNFVKIIKNGLKFYPSAQNVFIINYKGNTNI